MAHQKRGRYWYISEREGDRVVTRYLGAGAAGELIATHDAYKQAERAERAAAQRVAREAEAEAARAVRAHEQLVRALMVEALTAAGYHLHRRQWRKQR